MKTTIQGAIEMDMEVAEDCVVFAARCVGHQILENAVVMIQQAKAAGKDKIVVVGDCDDHNSVQEERLAEAMSSAGIEHIWLWEECFCMKEAMPAWSETGVKRFDEAKSFGELRVLLDVLGQKARDLKLEIAHDKELLAKFPVVAKVEAIESHDHADEYKSRGRAAFATLFGWGYPSDSMVSKVNAVMLLDPATGKGLLVTKSKEIEFCLTRPHDFDLDVLRGRRPDGRGYTRGKDGCGSVRISVGEGVPEISVYCYPGEWTISPHPELKTMDPALHYTPMWKRVVKA